MLRERREVPGRHRSELWMGPANQGFEALDGACRHRNFRLIDQRQRVAVDGAAQIRDEGEPPTMLLVASRAVNCHPRARLIGVLERALYPLQQLVRRRAV